MRQIEMLRHVPRQGKISPQQLHRRLADLGYDTTERTVQRDLQALSSMVPIVCDDESKPHGWYWSKTAPVWNLPGLSLSEAFAFQLLEKFSSSLLPSGIGEQLQPYFIAAREQVNREVGPSLARNWLRKVRCVEPGQPLLPASASADVLREVHAALMQNSCLQIRYRSPQANDRIVHPLGLVQHGQIFYAVVNYDGFPDIRLIALHRIRKAKMLEQEVVTPPGFDLDHYIAQGGLGFGEYGKAVKLTIRMSNYAGEHLKETKLSEDQVITDTGPGEVRVVAKVQLTRRLRWWLLAFGPDVEVVAPAKLRDEMREQLRAALERYEPPTGVRS